MLIGRRLIRIGLVVLLMLGGVWAGQPKTQQVSILMPAPHADATAELVKQFNVEHRGRINLKVIRGPLETESISDLAISSLLLGTPPFDALLVDVTWLPKYVAAGWLEPLDRWFDPADEAQLVQGAKLGNRIDGTLYRWPFGADVGLLYWRTDLMQEPPRTPEELVSTLTDLQSSEPDLNGFVWQGRQYEGLSCAFLEMLRAFGGQWLDPGNGEPQLNSPEALRAAAWMKDLLRRDVSPQAVTNYAESDVLQVFKAGDAALMRNWPYAWAELQAPGSAVQGRVGVTTMVAEPGLIPAATLGSWGLSILRGTQHPEATAEAIRYITSTEAQRDRFLGQGYTPTATSLFQDPELLAVAPVLPELAGALDHAVARPSTPLYAQMSDLLQRQLSGILTGTVPVKDGMAQAQDATLTLMRAAGGDA